MMNTEYIEFLNKKMQLSGSYGFEPLWMPDFLYDFQKSLVEWSLLKGRSAIFADCGLGKTPMQLVWAENITRKVNKPVLILTPLAVSHQTVREAEKFGIECERSSDGKFKRKIVVTNYERLHYFDPKDFIGVVCDESGCLKNFDGIRRKAITEFMRVMSYRLLCTATPSPNDYMELGTSSEALGELGFMDMLGRFFKNDQNNTSYRRLYGKTVKWRFKKHAEIPFWRWVCSWARAMRRPSDLGFDDGPFILPPLNEIEHVVKANSPRPGLLFEIPAFGIREEREERRHTLMERCEKVSELVNHKRQVLVWCHLNKEGDMLANLIEDSKQIRGSDSDEIKEERLLAFANGDLRVLVTKPKIGAWGLNLQNCAHVVFFADHSYESYYQGIRRCWRFGQTRKVDVDVILTEGERRIMENLRRKSDQADRMFSALVIHMNEAIHIRQDRENTIEEKIPSWLS